MMTSNLSLAHRLLKGDLSIPFYLSLLKLVLHLAVNATGGYGLFRDEFYYIACSRNLAAGYVDQPPLCAWILRLATSLIGDSLFSVRFMVSVASAITVFVTGLIALRLGGGRLAVFIASILCFSPVYLAMGGFYSMNAFDILFWVLSAYIIIRIIQDQDPKWWIVLGIILGFGLLNKIGVLFFGAGIFAGLLLTDERKWLATRWPYIAGAIAFAMFLPYIIWNFQHSFAHLEFIRNASAEKYSSQTAMTFILGQILINNPMALLIWVPGLIALLTSSFFRPYRILGWLFVVPLVIFLVNGTSKAEYLAPAYGILFAAGGVFWERLTLRVKGWRYVLISIMSLWIILALVVLPLVIPMLPVETYISYADAIGFKPESSEGKEQSELPQFYADMFGWKEKVEGVAEVFNALPDDEKKQCAIFASNYGRCASIDYFGDEYGLPKTIGNHNNYWIWGPRGYTGNVMIILGGDLSDHQPNFAEVTLAKVIDCRYCMPYEDNLPVYVCKGIKADLATIWPEEKHFE